jgi:hypothetical protein
MAFTSLKDAQSMIAFSKPSTLHSRAIMGFESTTRTALLVTGSKVFAVRWQLEQKFPAIQSQCNVYAPRIVKESGYAWAMIECTQVSHNAQA